MSHFLVLGSTAAAYSPGLWTTDLSVLRFQETCNANVPLVGRAFIKKWNMSYSDMRLVQRLGDCVQGIEVQGMHRMPGLGEYSYKKGPLAGNPGLWELGKGNEAGREIIHILTGQTFTKCLPCIKQVRALEHHSIEQGKP